MYRVELILSNYSEVRLEEFRFYDSDLPAPLVTFNGGSPAYCTGASKNLFNWTVGVRAVTLLLLKAAAGRGTVASISGEARSLASSLDYALSKEPAWLFDFFGITSSGHSKARNLFGRRNCERKRPGPVEVYLNDGLLKPSDIGVFLNEQRVEGDALQGLLTLLNQQSLSGPERSPAPGTPLANTIGNDFHLRVTERILKHFADYENKIAHVSLTTRYRNEGSAPILFRHYNLHSGSGGSTTRVSVTCPDDPLAQWHPVIDENERERILLTYNSPVAPGEERTEHVSFEINDYSILEDKLYHTVRPPTDSLTFEFSCSASHKVVNTSLFAECDNELRFTSLPKPMLVQNDRGEPSVRWTMNDPAQGFSYQLLWGGGGAGGDSAASKTRAFFGDRGVAGIAKNNRSWTSIEFAVAGLRRKARARIMRSLRRYPHSASRPGSPVFNRTCNAA